MHRLSAQVWLRTVLPDCSRGLRAALATVVPFYFSIALNRPELAWIAIGGWLGSLVDSGGSRGRRAVLIGTFALGGGLVVALTTLARTWPLGGVVLLAGLAWLTSLVRALGGSAAGWGTTLLVAACIASGVDSAGPVRDGLLFALGASWAVVLSSVVWPVWTHLPLRRALADVLDELAEYCSRVRQAGVAALPPHHAGWTLVARESQRRVRAAIENARLVALLLRSRRSGETGVGSGLRILLGDTETEFAKLISAAERFELSPSERDKMLPGLARL